ncbi:MAG: AI-2E family transporter [Deltaproteobacteria bacterium]|nr:AI-2E family transporter [Deltaproteobacteria bacterium]
MERSRISVALLAVLATVAVGFVLQQAQSVILPLIIAWLLSFILAPAVNMMAGKRVPRPIAIFLVLVLLIGILYIAIIFLNGRISTFISAFPKYHSRFNEITQLVRDRFNLAHNPLTEFNWMITLRTFLVKLSGSLLFVMNKLILVVIFLVFILLGHPYLRFKIKKALSDENAEKVTLIINTISSQFSRYLVIQFIISLATGILVWLSLTVIGVDFAVTWGALAFLLNFIPTIGSIISAVPPILLAFIQFFPVFWPGVATFIALLTIHMVIGSVVAPKVVGDRLNLSPVVILLSLLFWGWLWGIIGALLSVPIASAVKILCENVEELRPISIMMGSGKSYQDEFSE